MVKACMTQLSQNTLRKVYLACKRSPTVSAKRTRQSEFCSSSKRKFVYSCLQTVVDVNCHKTATQNSSFKFPKQTT